MSQFAVTAHYLPNYGGGRLIIERDRIELSPAFIGRNSSRRGELRHAGNVIHWLRLRIAWPWMRNGLVIFSGDAIAVAFMPPFRRSRLMKELQHAGFTLIEHSLWSYSRKSLSELLSLDS
jgi:hypothetical protein